MKAIDIAILPPKSITDLAIELNKELKGPRNIELNKQDQLPHITLLFGGVEEENIQQVWQKAQQLFSNTEPFEIKITSIRYGGSTGLHIQRSSELIELHTKLVQTLSPLLNYNVTTEHFANSEEVFDKSTSWVNNYLENSSRDNYDPHITIGDGKLPEEDLPKFPITFGAKHIALCQLGNLCTCNKILFETKL